jgi:hypothetical protein
VRDLAAAAADYRALGFALKPGRPHDNGITNQHAKFPDGTELELITAPEARDALTTTYRRHLEQGEGPSFFALFAPRQADAEARLAEAKIALPPYIFLGPRNQSPTDLPEHFVHANTAQSLVRVWLAGEDLSGERRLLEVLGATFAVNDVRVPDTMRVTVARLGEGEVLFLPRDRQRLAGRPVVGATLRVADIGVTRGILARRAGVAPEIVSSPGGRSIFLPPERTHGLWLEFWQPAMSIQGGPPRPSPGG